MATIPIKNITKPSKIEEKVEVKNIEKSMSVNTFSNIKGIHHTDTFFLNKKYKGQEKTLKEWNDVLIFHKILVK